VRTDAAIEGSRLGVVPHNGAFWFVWIAFTPDTEVVGEE